MRSLAPACERWLAIGLAVFSLCGCGDSRVVSGPSATETGNALQTRLIREDGSAAAGARVAVRRSSAMDQTGAILLTADASGLVSTRLETGDWTLEAREAGAGLRIDVRLGSDTALDTARLLRLGTVVGRLQSTQQSPSLAVSGLGRRIDVAADGSFRIDSIPWGSQPLVLVGTSASWNLKIAPGKTDSVLLDENRPGELFQTSSIRTIVEGGLLPRRSILSGIETGWPLAQTEWTDSNGTVVPVFPLSDSLGPAFAWTFARNRATLQPRRILSGRAIASQVFRPADGFRLALAFPRLRPDQNTDDTAGNLAASDAVPLDPEGDFLSDPSEGEVRRAPIGASLLRLDASTMPPAEGTVSIRVRMEQPDVGRIWLLDWTDSATSGLRVGIGAGALYVRMADTSEIEIPAENLGAYSTWNISWNATSMRIGRDGKSLFERKLAFPQTPRTRCVIGTGGGLRMSHLLILDRSIPLDSISW
ncbi:MAG: hypothetical protein IPK50_20770 [Fibrobacterota bacterium]|nr:MAG: hypothetical protein IPK50_20770 [Fibrobacterota bacterium]